MEKEINEEKDNIIYNMFFSSKLYNLWNWEKIYT